MKNEHAVREAARQQGLTLIQAPGGDPAVVSSLPMWLLYNERSGAVLGLWASETACGAIEEMLRDAGEAHDGPAVNAACDAGVLAQRVPHVEPDTATEITKLEAALHDAWQLAGRQYKAEALHSARRHAGLLP